MSIINIEKEKGILELSEVIIVNTLKIKSIKNILPQQEQC